MNKPWMKTARLSGVAILLLLGAAQGGFARGLGIKAGEGRLHPAVELDLVYDNNVGYFSTDPVGDLILRIRPGLTLSFPSKVVSIELTGKVGYDYFFGVEDAKTTDLSSVQGEAQLAVGFNPEGQLSFFVEDRFLRTGDPQYTSLAGRFDRTTNEVRGHAQYKPGGEAMIFDLAYGFYLDWFDQGAGFNSDDFNSFSHRIFFSGKWKFLPKTALVLDFDSDLRRYPHGTAVNLDTNAIRINVGMLGQITPTIAVTVKVGFGDTLMPTRTSYTGSDYRSVIGLAEVAYRSGTTFIQGGYTRNFQPVVLFGYFSQDRIYAKLRQQIVGKIGLVADFSFDHLAYGTPVQAAAAARGDRTDNVIYGTLGVAYMITDWLDIGAAYDLQLRLADWGTVSAQDPSVDYRKHLFTLRVSVDY
jgi:hypothetical protein